MDRFNLKRLNDMGFKNSITLKSRVRLKLWKTWMIMRA